MYYDIDNVVANFGGTTTIIAISRLLHHAEIVSVGTPKTIETHETKIAITFLKNKKLAF